jgi:hypothetical protein
MEFDGVLKERAVMEHAYDVQDLDDDLKAADELRAKGLLKARSLLPTLLRSTT